MRALVTGGAGFIGSNLVNALLAQGHEVRVIDNFATGHRHNLTPFAHDIELVEGDLQSYERAHKAVQGVEVVFHQAALPSVPRSVQDPLTTNAVNITGTLNILLSARDSGVRRVVYASSSSAYGNNPATRESRTPPRSPLLPMQSPNWPASTTVVPLRTCTRWRRYVSATSMSSARGRTRTASTLRSFPDS